MSTSVIELDPSMTAASHPVACSVAPVTVIAPVEKTPLAPSPELVTEPPVIVIELADVASTAAFRP